MIAWLQPQQDLLNGLRNLADVRNDLNHAGHNDKACTPKTIQNKLVGHIERFSLLIITTSSVQVFMQSKLV